MRFFPLFAPIRHGRQARVRSFFELSKSDRPSEERIERVGRVSRHGKAAKIRRSLRFPAVSRKIGGAVTDKRRAF